VCAAAARSSASLLARSHVLTHQQFDVVFKLSEICCRHASLVARCDREGNQGREQLLLNVDF